MIDNNCYLLNIEHCKNYSMENIWILLVPAKNAQIFGKIYYSIYKFMHYFNFKIAKIYKFFLHI